MSDDDWPFEPSLPAVREAAIEALDDDDRLRVALDHAGAVPNRNEAIEIVCRLDRDRGMQACGVSAARAWLPAGPSAAARRGQANGVRLPLTFVGGQAHPSWRC